MVTFFAGLEHEQDTTCQVGLPGGEHLRRAGEHRDVGVVTAGVHRALDRAGAVEPGVLRHRQRVHVAPQQDRRARLVAGQQRGHARRLLVHGDVESQAVDPLEHLLLGERQLVADLGAAVEEAPERDCLRQQVLRLGEQRVEGHGAHGRRVW